MFGDRLWNGTVCEDMSEFGRAATRWALGIDTPEGLDIYEKFGGYMQPRSVEGVRMWVDKAAKDLGETYEILKKLDRPNTYTGRLAHEYVLSIDWLNEKRG